MANAAEALARSLHANAKSIWEELPPEAIETEEEFLMKRLYQARAATIEKYNEMIRDLREVIGEVKKKVKPERTAAEIAAKKKALVEMGIPASFPMERAGTKIGIRLLEDAAAKCMHESLKAGDHLGDAYLFLERAAVEPEKRTRWQIKVMKKGEKLEEQRARLYDKCGVILPAEPLTHENYDKYKKQLEESYREKIKDLQHIRKKTRSKFYYESVPKCGLNAMRIAQKISEIQGLILAGKPGYPEYPAEPIRKEILEQLGFITEEEAEEMALTKRRNSLETLLKRLERDGCVCGDLPRRNAYLIKEIKEKIKNGDKTVIEDLEELKTSFGTCLNRKMLPMKVPLPAEKAKKLMMEVVVNTRVMTDLISKWGAIEAANEFWTDRLLMEMVSKGFGKTFESPQV